MPQGDLLVRQPFDLGRTLTMGLVPALAQGKRRLALRGHRRQALHAAPDRRGQSRVPHQRARRIRRRNAPPLPRARKGPPTSARDTQPVRLRDVRVAGSTRGHASDATGSLGVLNHLRLHPRTTCPQALIGHRAIVRIPWKATVSRHRNALFLPQARPPSPSQRSRPEQGSPPYAKTCRIRTT